MRRTVPFLLLALFSLALVTPAISGIPKPKTMWEIKAKKKLIREVVGDQGQFIWVRNDEDVTVYDGTNGKKLWESELKGYEEDGLHEIINWHSSAPKYIYSIKRGLVCIDIATGKTVWEAALEVKAKKYLRYYSTPKGVLMEFDTDEQHYILFNLDDGKIIWQHSKSEGFTPYEKFEKKGIPVIHTYGDRFLMIMKKKVSLIDAATGAELWKAEKKYLSDEWGEDAIFEQEGALVLFFEKGVGMVRLSDGKELWYREEEVEDANKVFFRDTPEGKIGVFTFKDAVLCFRLSDGSVLWEHNNKMKPEERLVGAIEGVYDVPDSPLKLFITWKSKLMGTDNGGLVTANGVDWKTGKIVYKTNLIRAGANPPSLFGLLSGMKRIRVTYYEVLDQTDGKLTILLKATNKGSVKDVKKYDYSKYDPELPNGEGLMRFDPKTGKVEWRHYFDYLTELQDIVARVGAAGGSIGLGKGMETAYQFNNAARSRELTKAYLTDPVISNGNVYLCADRKVMAFEIASGKKVWETPEVGNATQWVEIDNAFYVQIGRTFKSYSYTLNVNRGACKAKETKVQTKKPFGFLAVDKGDGKIIWDMTKEKEFKEDPTSYLAEYHAGRKTYYCSDGKFIFAIPLTREGKIAWKHTLKELGIGSVDPDEGVVFIEMSRSTSSSSYYSGNSFGTTITTSVEYSVNRVLGVEYRKDEKGLEYILGVGEDGLVRVDLDGKVVWKADKKVWDWDKDDVTFVPFYLPDGDIAFGFNRRLTRIDIKTGAPVFQVKEDKSSTFEVQPNGKSLIVMNKKFIKSYDLTQAE